MFENFKKIKIKGGCFINETELELFRKDAVSVVYGRNGSGKSTIAHNINNLVTGPENEENPEFTVSTEAAIPEEMKKSVFVFNEDFVNNQVKVGKDGIDTIVMLGEQVGIDERINDAKKELASLHREYETLNDLMKKYENADDVISPHYYFKQVNYGLREAGGWYDTYCGITGKQENITITGPQVTKLLEIKEPKATYDELRYKLADDLKLFYNSRKARAVEWKPGSIGRLLPLKEVENLLTMPLDIPTLSERERRLMSLIAKISQQPQRFSQLNTREMVQGHWEFCPLCLRKIDHTDRRDIMETLNHILNKKAEKFEGKLETLLRAYAPKEIVFPEFPNHLYENEIYRAKVALEDLNKMLSRVREIIEIRQHNIYERVEQPFTEEEKAEYEYVLKNWKRNRDALMRCVEKYNDAVYHRQDLITRLENENDLLARKQFAPMLQSILQARENMNNSYMAYRDKQREMQRVSRRISDLQRRKERTDIALDYINKELSYVFYSKKISLQSGNGCYRLLVNGQSVKPNKISVGERNVLGLCYFFASLYGGKTDATKYQSEYLIVIDDPVSSFDYGNRVGVMSLLRYQFRNIVKGNANSRILVMSHDLRSVFDLVKIRNEMVEGRRPDQSFLELVNNKLEVKYMQNEYKKLLEFVYAYATDAGADDPDDRLEMSIGNVMRRMMEAFSSFCYNDTFEKMVRKEDVLAVIPEGKRSYYENFMCRLVLNTESHMADRVYSLDTITACFTRPEKVQTAKSVLLFLLYINKPHLTAYLTEAQLATIEGWETEEAGWLVK